MAIQVGNLIVSEHHVGFFVVEKVECINTPDDPFVHYTRVMNEFGEKAPARKLLGWGRGLRVINSQEELRELIQERQQELNRLAANVSAWIRNRDLTSTGQKCNL